MHETRQDETQRDKTRLKVVVIDDNRGDIAVCQRYLARDPDHDVEVKSASGGEAGIALVEKERPDCVLLDYRLPDMTGLEVLHRLRAPQKIHSVPIVMLTGSVDESLVLQALKTGAQDYLSKANLSAENLLRAVHNAIEKVTAVRRLEDALNARDEFLSIASHELKTPITTLTLQMGHGSLLLSELQTTDPKKDKLIEMLSRANTQLGRLSRLIDSLLDVSRISADRLDFEIEQVDLGEMVRGVVERLGEQLSAVGCPVELRVRAAVVGEFDRFRLEQVVVNLVSNAIKYASGKPVLVEVLADAGWAVVHVRDQGIGISHDQQARIFDRFDRGKAPRGTQGLGLGLYIAKKIVDLHAGTLTVESTLGKGSTFTVRLPLETSTRSLSRGSFQEKG